VTRRQNRHAGSIAGLPEFVSPSRAFHLGQVAVALEHQVGDAPNIDLGDHAGQRYRSNLYRRLKHKDGKVARSAAFALGVRHPISGAMQHLELSDEEAAALNIT